MDLRCTARSLYTGRLHINLGQLPTHTFKYVLITNGRYDGILGNGRNAHGHDALRTEYLPQSSTKCPIVEKRHP